MTQAELHYKKMTETPVTKLVVTLGIPTTISMLKQELSHIASSGNASSIKSTDGDDWSRIIIVSNEKDVDILISAIDSDDISLVYISCNEEIVGEILNKYANK